MPVLVEVVWTVVGPSGKPLICGLYRDAAGFELRCHSAESVDALIRSKRAADIDAAREIAEAWKKAVLAKGFEEDTE